LLITFLGLRLDPASAAYDHRRGRWVDGAEECCSCAASKVIVSMILILLVGGLYDLIMRFWTLINVSLIPCFAFQCNYGMNYCIAIGHSEQGGLRSPEIACERWERAGRLFALPPFFS
jgi:hypothetical protein